MYGFILAGMVALSIGSATNDDGRRDGFRSDGRSLERERAQRDEQHQQERRDQLKSPHLWYRGDDGVKRDACRDEHGVYRCERDR